MAPIRVLTVTTDVTLQTKLRVVSQQITNLELVAGVDTVSELARTTDRVCPNIILFDTAADIRLNNGVIARLMEQCPKVNIFLLGSEVEMESSDDVRSIRTLAELRLPFQARPDPYKGRKPETHGSGLSAREIEVLQLVADGLSSDEVADHLVTSVRTVESYRTQIMKKSNRRTVAGLTKYAIGQGLTTL